MLLTNLIFETFYFVKRHFAYLIISLGAVGVGFYLSPSFWSKYRLAWILLSILLLAAVLERLVTVNVPGPVNV